MLIKVKVGKVELEYSEPTKPTEYPKITLGAKDSLLMMILKMADKAAEIHASMEI